MVRRRRHEVSIGAAPCRSYRSWLDAVGTAIAVQQKLMRHFGIRTKMNLYGDMVTDEMERANSKAGGAGLNRQAITN